MKKRRFFAVLLVLALLLQFPVAAWADEGGGSLGKLEEIWQNAAVHYAFTGEERVFDGTRTVDKSEDLSLVSGLTKGTIIVRARFEGEPTTNQFYSLLGFGNPTDDSTRQIVLGANGTPFSTRYEFGDGLYSTAMKSIPFSDNKWHTIAFTAGDGYVSVSVDGQSGSTGADGYYNAAKWNGFMTRGQNLDSFTIGGFSSASHRLNPYTNWVGDIDFVTITSQVLSPAEANEITGLFKAPVELSLDAQPIADPASVGSVVGTLRITGEGAEQCTPTLPEGEGDNDKFALEGTTLKTAAALEPFSSYTVVVRAGLNGVEDARFTVTTLGDVSGALLTIEERTDISSPIRYPALAAPAGQLEDLTIQVQFVQSVSGIGSLISFSNSGEAAKHMHLYANGSTIGYELRGAGVADVHRSAPALRSLGLNTVAFKADSQSRTFKIFANGELVNTYEMTAETYRMLKDIAGLDAVTVGSTPRNGNNYPFTGTLLHLSVHGTALTDEELIAYTAATAPEEGGGSESPHIFEATGSNYYRIPALYTLADGTVMAAVDARFGGAADSPNNLDTGVNFLAPGADAWGTATMPFHFEDYSDEGGYASNSASFIDPVIAQGADGTIYLAVDAFPAGYGYPNCATGTGMRTVEGQTVLALTKKGNSVNQWANFDHYVLDGVVYDGTGTPTGYTMDEYFNLYKDGEALYVAQRRAAGGTNGKQVPMNVFYADSDFKVYATSYLWLITSTDGGATWSAPQNLNYLKRDADRFWGTGPGRGHTVQVGDYAGRVVLPTYDSQDGERASMIYTDDNGATWQRGARTTMAASNSPGKSSESQLVELPDGTLRLFARGSTGRIGYADSTDGGHSFAPMKQDAGLAYCGNVMISAINYSGLIDGLPAIVLSCPEGSGRNNGIIRIGLITENGPEAAEKYSIDWKYKYSVNSGGFVYSCLTELPDGNIGLLWENDPNNLPCIYSVYTIDELKAGAKSSVESFVLENPADAVPGGEITVALTLKSKVVGQLSDLENAALSIEYPESEHPAGGLAFAELLEDGKTLLFKGSLPMDEQGYGFRVTIPADINIFTLAGSFVPIASDRLDGVINNPVDFAPLAELVVAQQGREQEIYTPASWSAFATALAQAQEILDTKTANQSAVDAAYTALSDAALALAQKPDKSRLAQTIEQFAPLKEVDHTEESWPAFAAAMAEARRVNEDANATGQEVQKAAMDLLAARLALVSLPDKTILLAALEKARGTSTEGCTEGSVQALQQAIAHAEEIYSSRAVTAEQVAGAVSGLVDAMQALKDAGDKSGLLTLYELGLTLEQGSYTAGSWGTFNGAMASAYACLENTEAGQGEVDAAYDTLFGAMLGLTQKADKSSLDPLIQNAQNVLENATLYVPSTLTGLQDALDAALAVRADDDATQAQVNAAGSTLADLLGNVRMLANKNNLRRTLSAARTLNLSAYTPETVAPLQTVMEQAQTLLDSEDENLAQETLDEIERELMRLMASLQRPAPTPPPAPTETEQTPPTSRPNAPNHATPASRTAAQSDVPVTAAPADADADKTDAASGAPGQPIGDTVVLPDEPVPQAAPVDEPTGTEPLAATEQSVPWLLILVVLALVVSVGINILLVAKRRKKQEP